MGVWSSFRRKGGGALTHKVTADLAKQSVNGDANELGITALLNVSNGATAPVDASGAPVVAFTSASYQAHDPCSDRLVLESSSSGAQPHVFAAVLTSERYAHGGEHLRRNLYREVTQQLKLTPIDPLAALKTSLIALDVKFRALHHYNANVLSGTQITAAYLDLSTNKLHVISNGGCRVVVAARRAGAPHVVIELGRPTVRAPPAAVAATAGTHEDIGRRTPSESGPRSGASAPQQSSAAASWRGTAEGAGPTQPLEPPKLANGAHLLPAGMATVELTEDVESIILGSPGLWRELTAHQAALRAQEMVKCAPHATGGNTAAHLTQLALQAVAARTSRQISDPRMSSLRTPGHLQQLWMGSRANYRWGGRQPLRRRRGDVHGDLSALVLRLDWDSGEMLRKGSMQSKMRRMSSMAALPKAVSLGSLNSLRAKGLASHWDLVRMHFLEYLPATRAAARARWYDAVDAAFAASAAQKSAARAATAADDETPAAIHTPKDGDAAVAKSSESVEAVAVSLPESEQDARTAAAPTLSTPTLSSKAEPRACATPPIAVRVIAGNLQSGTVAQSELDSRPEASSASATLQSSSFVSPPLQRASSTPAASMPRSAPSASLAMEQRSMRARASMVQPQHLQESGPAAEEVAARRRTLGGASRRDLTLPRCYSPYTHAGSPTMQQLRVS